MRGWLGPVVVVLAGGASCEPIAAPPPPDNPINSCPAYPCASFKTPDGLGQAVCSSGLCASNATLDFSLVVSAPETAPVDPAITVAIPPFYSVFLPSLTSPGTCLPQPQACCQAPTCIHVPAAISVSASLVYSAAIASCAGLQGGVAIPSSATFRPRWRTTPSSPPADADSIGLPLLPTQAGPSPNVGSWLAVLSPPYPAVSPVLDYEESVVPVDDAYPPSRSFGTFLAPPVNAPASGQCQSPGATTFAVDSDGPSLRGFQVYLRDPATLERLSSRVTLGDVPGVPVALYITTDDVVLQGSQLVIEPPAGLQIPTFADTVPPLGGLQSERFPLLPTAVAVSGTVRDATLPEGNPIEADLVITSNAGGIVNMDLAAPNTQQALSYATTAHSSPVNGSYSVVLPPGSYQVFIAPVAGVPAGQASVPLDVAAPQNGAPSAGAGKTLIADSLWPVIGTVTVADGRALSGAVVEAHAAASIAGSDPRLWPRTASTVTDANGAYTLSVNPGTYNLVVQPASGSGFPWVTTTSLSIPAGGRNAFDVVVPAPIVVPLTIHDAVNNPLSSAVVRAYVPGAAPSDGGAPPQIELGAWFTDPTGHFTMLLAPPN